METVPCYLRLTEFRFCLKVCASLFLGKAARVKSALKRILIVLAVVVLAPVLLVSLAILGSGDWRTVGQTDAGDRVFVSKVRVLKNDQRMALIRVEYKQPTELPQGGPFTELRASVRFNCASGSATPTGEWFYARDPKGHLVTKKITHDESFGQTSEGGFGDLVSKSVCSQAR
jgi:hypothetical protein